MQIGGGIKTSGLINRLEGLRGEELGVVYIMTDEEASRQPAVLERSTRRIRGNEMQARVLGKMHLMLQSLVHDLGNKLLPINIYCALLGKNEVSNLTDQGVKNLDRMSEAVNEINSFLHLLRSLYQFDHVSSGEFTELGSCLANCLDKLHKRIGNVFDVRISIEPDIPKIAGNPVDVENALLEIIRNGVEAMHGFGSLEIVCGTTQGMPDKAIMVSIKDDGPGMDDRDLERCFTPFFTAKGGAHIGLGLAIAHAAIGRVGGDIEIESILGGGTTVRLLFNAAQESSGEHSAPNHSSPGILNNSAQAERKGKILVVDDDFSVLSTLDLMLGTVSNKVKAMSDPTQALEEFYRALDAGDQFDMVISDMKMQGTNGLQLLSNVKAADKLCMTVLISGDLNCDSQAIHYVDHFLVKPISVNQLRSLARLALGIPS